MRVQRIVETLCKRRIIAGPDHFVLGDGYGNPDRHSSLYVVVELFYMAKELQEILAERLCEQLEGLEFDMIVTPDIPSVATARVLANCIERKHGHASLPLFSVLTDDLPQESARALIHDDIINNGKQANDLIKVLDEKHIKPVAISSMFTRISGKSLFGLPVFAAVDRMLASYPADECPMCQEGQPINTRHGKGTAYLAQQELLRAKSAGK